MTMLFYGYLVEKSKDKNVLVFEVLMSADDQDIVPFLPNLRGSAKLRLEMEYREEPVENHWYQIQSGGKVSAYFTHQEPRTEVKIAALLDTETNAPILLRPKTIKITDPAYYF